MGWDWRDDGRITGYGYVTMGHRYFARHTNQYVHFGGFAKTAKRTRAILCNT
jgi:hypothetical protein